MMILRSAPPSPFGRKARIAAAMLGLDHEIEIVAADTQDADDTIRAQNPLGKIPALLLEDGQVIFDSRVILEALDARAGGGRLIPSHAPERIRVLALQALADGLIEAAILQVYEVRFRPPEKREPRWVAHQAGKVERALAAFEATPPAGPRDAAHVALACALGYLDLRFAGAWRDAHPSLVAWLDGFAAEVPSFAATAMPA